MFAAQVCSTPSAEVFSSLALPQCKQAAAPHEDTPAAEAPAPQAGAEQQGPAPSLASIAAAVQLARETVAIEAPGAEKNQEFLMEVVDEFVNGLALLSTAPQRITVFGAARCTEDREWYRVGREVGRAIAEAGYAVLTGGGPGLMEAANRGAVEADGYSIGFNILLPFEQEPNPYLNAVVDFKHFFVRKALLRWESTALIALPGGFGTFDELFETLTLRQTGKMPDIPIVLVGKDFWSPLLEFLTKSPEAQGFVSHGDIEGVALVDSGEEALRYIEEYKRSRIAGARRASEPEPCPAAPETVM